MSATTVSLGFLLALCCTLYTTCAAVSGALKLSPLINENRIEKARNLSLVDPSLFLNFTSYSGFLTVDKRYDSNLFFWYFPVTDKEKHVNETPWIVWLQGGPGASSLTGLFDEIGPFQYDQHSRKLKLREWSWTKHYSVLFIDNPVDAGFSFTNSQLGYVRDMNTYSIHLYGVLQQFLMIFPELRKAPLYIAGESYAGRYVPALAMKILEPELKPVDDMSVNLQGLIMGNPVLNRENIANFTALFYQWGLIDNQGVLAAKSLQDDYISAIRNNNNDKAYHLRDLLLDKLQDISFQTQTYNVLKDDMDFKGYMEFVTSPPIREAIHVGDAEFLFSSANVHEALVGDFLSKISPKIETLLEHYKILIYCGQLDMTAACVPNAEARRKYWHWNQREQFLKAPRTPWWFNETVAGYVKSGGGFTEVLVRGAGHLVPIEKPAETVQMISNFVNGWDFTLPTNYQLKSVDTPEYVENDVLLETKSDNRPAFVTSVVINVFLVLCIVAGLIYFLRWKKRSETFFYATVEDSLSDGVLSMS